MTSEQVTVTLEPEHVTAALKSVSQSIISIRRRLPSFSGTEEQKQNLEDDLQQLLQVRDRLEAVS